MKRVPQIVWLGLALFITDCGSRNTRLGTTNPTRQPVNQTVSGEVAAYRTIRHSLAVPRTGTMTLRLTWNTPAVDLELHLANASCLTLYPMKSCGITVSSTSAIGAEQISRFVHAGEKYSVFVDNLDPRRPQRYSLSLLIP